MTRYGTGKWSNMSAAMTLINAPDVQSIEVLLCRNGRSQPPRSLSNIDRSTVAHGNAGQAPGCRKKIVETTGLLVFSVNVV